MSRKTPNIELFFVGTDFTPLLDRDGNPNFGFSIKYNGGQFTFKDDADKKKGPKVFLLGLLERKELQLNLLQSFLLNAQRKINEGELILDKSLAKDERCVFDYCNGQMCFGGLVGVVSIKDFKLDDKHIGNVTLQICTRLDAKGKCQAIADKLVEGSTKKKDDSLESHFLMTLLFQGYTPLMGSRVHQDAEAFSDMLLLYSFVQRYKEAYAKGYYKTYHRMEKNDDRLKGTIDIARHIRLNAGMNNGKIAYSYKEKGEFNYINHLIVASYEKLKKKCGKDIGAAFQDALEEKNSIETLEHLISYPQYSTKTILSKTINPLTHPFYTEYEDLRRICVKILHEEKVSPINGTKKEEVEGVLMYVPTLWEKYIAKHLRGTGFKAQDKIAILDVNDNRNYQQNTRPDFVFYEDGKPYMILDAKFKPGWLDAAKTGKVGDFLLPDYDKCVRDMVSINGNATGVIFPVEEAIEDYENDSFRIGGKSYRYVHNISRYNDKQKFYAFPIYVPKSGGKFREWKKGFDDSCGKVFEIMKTLILNHQKPKSNAS